MAKKQTVSKQTVSRPAVEAKGPFFEILLTEKEQLAKKTDELNSFMSSTPEFNRLGQQQKDLLLIQLKSMKTYLDCVTRRIDLLKSLEVEK